VSYGILGVKPNSPGELYFCMLLSRNLLGEPINRVG